MSREVSFHVFPQSSHFTHLQPRTGRREGRGITRCCWTTAQLSVVWTVSAASGFVFGFIDFRAVVGGARARRWAYELRSFFWPLFYAFRAHGFHLF